VIPLRGLRLGELLEATVATLRRSARIALSVGGVLALLGGAAQLLSQAYLTSRGVVPAAALPDPGTQVTPEQARDLLLASGPILIAAAVSFIVGLVLQTLAAGVTAPITGAAVRGQPLDWERTWQRMRPLLPRLLALTVLITGVLGGVVLLPLLLSMRSLSTQPESAIAAMVLSMLVTVPIAAFLWTRLMLAPVALILEGGSLADAVRRGWSVVRRRGWRAFGVALMIVLLGQVLATVVQFPFAIVGAATAADSPSTLAVFASTIGVMVGFTVMLPFIGVGMGMLYTDLRLRAEPGLAAQLNRPE